MIKVGSGAYAANRKGKNMDRKPVCETLKALINTQNINVSALDLVEMKESINWIENALSGMKPNIFSSKFSIALSVYSETMLRLGLIRDFLNNKTKGFTLSDTERQAAEKMLGALLSMEVKNDE